MIGGRSGSSDFGDVQRYDAAINTWITGPSIDPRGAAGATLLCDAIHVFGGESQLRSSVLGEAFRLDPVTEVWAAIPPMPTARVYARAVPFANSVYVVGGSPTPVRSHRSIGLSTVERYQAACVPSPLVPSPAPEA